MPLRDLDCRQVGEIRRTLRQIEEARLERMEQAPGDGPHAMVRLLARVIGVGIETSDMPVHDVLSRDCGIDGLWRAMLVSLAHRTRAAASGERKGLRRRATHEYAAA